MPLNKPGKRLRVKDTARIPKSFTSNISSFSNNTRVNNNNNTSVRLKSNMITANQTKLVEGYQTNSDAFGVWLRKNAITTLKKTLNTTATITSIDIRPVSNYGGGDYLLRKGDTFYLYDQFSYKNILLTADADLLHSATSISITSTAIKRGLNTFRDGAYVVFNNKTLVERVSNAPLFKRFNLTNAQYKALNTSPYTLLAAETGKLHIALNCTILFNRTSDELASADLYIGHNASSILIGTYWASISRAFYRHRDSQMYQLSPGIYGAGASSDHSRIALKSLLNNGIGNALTLYTTANLTNPSNTITILLYYKTITI